MTSTLTEPDPAADPTTTEDPAGSADEAGSAPRTARSEPVAVVMDFVGATLPDYDRLMRAMYLVPEAPGLPGCLFHWVRSTPTGIRVCEVWRSEKAFDFYLDEEVLPNIRALRLPEPETIRYAVHNYLLDGGAGPPIPAD